jgi:hypothetical protein
MAYFPGSVFNPREIENKQGVIFSAGETTRLFAEDIIALDDEVVAIETGLFSVLDQAVKTTSMPTFAGAILDGPVGINTSRNDVDFMVLTQAVIAALMVDGETGNVGLGTNTPAKKLTLYGTLDTVIRIIASKNDTTWTGVQSLGGLEIYGGDTNDSGPGVKFYLNCENMGGASGGEYGSNIDTVFRSATRLGGEGNLLEWLRVNYSGNIIINGEYLDKDVTIRKKTSGVTAHFDAGLGNVGIGTTTASAKITVDGGVAILDGMTAPATISGFAQIYVDTADGDLKIKFGDGTVKTIVTDS